MADVNTHRPDGTEVELVSADEWANMSITQLFEQQLILQNRLTAVMQYGNPAMIKQITIGVKQLEAIINQKERQNIRKINNRNRDLTGLI
jgi:hypothetical protein